MARPGLNRIDVRNIIESNDELFEKRITKLTMRELLDLVTGLQQAMASEQGKFDKVSLQLSSLKPDNSNINRQSIEELRNFQRQSQAKLATLCSRNMRCFTQQAAQAKQDQAHITSQTVVSKRQQPEKKSTKKEMLVQEGVFNKDKKDNSANDDESVGPENFRQRLAFFQNRTSETSPKTQHKSVVQKKDEGEKRLNGPKKSPSKMVPNVDDVLLSVKLLRESRQVNQNRQMEPELIVDDFDHCESDDSETFQLKQFNHYEKLFNAHADNEDFRASDGFDTSSDHQGTDGSNYGDQDDDYLECEESDEYANNRNNFHHYHHEDIGLEVIMEEDEESVNLKDDDYSEQIIDYQRSNQTVDCDSGVTDDQRSNSTGDELDSLAGDTDSAKGSMVPDAASQTSPTSSLGIGKDLEAFESIKLSHNSDHKMNKVHFEEPNLSVSEKVERIFQSCEAESSNFPPLQMNGSKQNHKITFSSNEWDPKSLIKEQYATKFPQIKRESPGSSDCINIDGYLEKLPSGRKKATFWNPWKRKYFKAKDGHLYYYESKQDDKEVICLQLMGGNIDTLDNNMIGVDDGKGHYLVMKCSNKDEANKWHRALLTHCMENFMLTYVQPVEFAIRSHKEILVIDLGSCSVRAGILGENPTLPQLFFPAICATDINTGKKVFGEEALSPNLKRNHMISFPLSPQKSKFTIDIESFPDLMKKIFNELNVDSSTFQIQFCISRKYSMQTQIAIAKIMFEQFKVEGCNITEQSIAALYSYNATSGIIVDIGNRLDILPVIDGYIVDSGVTRTPYGGQRVLHHLKQALAEKQYSFESESESFLIRYALEKLCFTTEDYKQEMKNFQMDPDSLESSVSLDRFNAPESEIILDSGRFSVTEGLFDPELWGLDLKGLHKLVHKAIMECSMDVRKEMTKSIYLCGGLTMLPGLADRLQKEVDKLTPSSLTPKVHASPYRYHASYIGGCILALNDAFTQVMISSSEWKQSGNACLSKWH